MSFGHKVSGELFRALLARWRLANLFILICSQCFVQFEQTSFFLNEEFYKLGDIDAEKLIRILWRPCSSLGSPKKKREQNQSTFIKNPASAIPSS